MKLDELLKLDRESLKGKVICFPTDTVYGVGCLYDDEIAYKKIYELKKRSFDKPLAILIGDIKDINLFCDELSGQIKEIINSYWPGALTIIVDKKKDSKAYDLFNHPTVGLRMPNSKVALTILKHFGPLATTSVNISGEKELNNIEEIKKTFGDLIDYYILDQEDFSCVSSTVIKIENDKIITLREGSIKIKE